MVCYEKNQDPVNIDCPACGSFMRREPYSTITYRCMNPECGAVLTRSGDAE